MDHRFSGNVATSTPIVSLSFTHDDEITMYQAWWSRFSAGETPLTFALSCCTGCESSNTCRQSNERLHCLWMAVEEEKRIECLDRFTNTRSTVSMEREKTKMKHKRVAMIDISNRPIHSCSLPRESGIVFLFCGAI